MAHPQITWFHSFDFDDGEVAVGLKSFDALRLESDIIFSESVAGKKVLDIGAWDGYFSFEAERRNASDVLATDHFCWSGPGWGTKAGFDYAHTKLKSRVRSLDVDVFDLNPEIIGVFDVVLFLGVLYHLENPFGGLKRVSKLTRELAVVETHVAELDNPNPVMRYWLNDELGSDPTNFFSPNHRCLESMLRDVGFKRLRFTPTHPERTIVHAWK
ncbi:MAG: class I SAM-dependent methyltransferase [Alphaproteobacteria bacterium]